jgi:hypothetical protein
VVSEVTSLLATESFKPPKEIRLVIKKEIKRARVGGAAA